MNEFIKGMALKGPKQLANMVKPFDFGGPMALANTPQMSPGDLGGPMPLSPPVGGNFNPQSVYNMAGGGIGGRIAAMFGGGGAGDFGGPMPLQGGPGDFGGPMPLQGGGGGIQGLLNAIFGGGMPGGGGIGAPGKDSAYQQVAIGGPEPVDPGIGQGPELPPISPWPRSTAPDLHEPNPLMGEGNYGHAPSWAGWSGSPTLSGQFGQPFYFGSNPMGFGAGTSPTWWVNYPGVGPVPMAIPTMTNATDQTGLLHAGQKIQST